METCQNVVKEFKWNEPGSWLFLPDGDFLFIFLKRRFANCFISAWRLRNNLLWTALLGAKTRCPTARFSPPIAWKTSFNVSSNSGCVGVRGMTTFWREQQLHRLFISRYVPNRILARIHVEKNLTAGQQQGQTDTQWILFYQQGKLKLTSCPCVRIHYYCTGESESLSRRVHPARRHDGRWVSVIFLAAGFGGLLSMVSSDYVAVGALNHQQEKLPRFQLGK